MGKKKKLITKDVMDAILPAFQDSKKNRKKTKKIVKNYLGDYA